MFQLLVTAVFFAVMITLLSGKKTFYVCYNDENNYPHWTPLK